MLRLQGINKYYQVGSHRLHVLRDVDVEVGDGELVAIMGASGSGKSTLLNILGILDGYDSGEYWLDETLVQVAEAAEVVAEGELGAAVPSVVEPREVARLEIDVSQRLKRAHDRPPLSSPPNLWSRDISDNTRGPGGLFCIINPPRPDRRAKPG